MLYVALRLEPVARFIQNMLFNLTSLIGLIKVVQLLATSSTATAKLTALIMRLVLENSLFLNEFVFCLSEPLSESPSPLTEGSHSLRLLDSKSPTNKDFLIFLLNSSDKGIFCLNFFKNVFHLLFLLGLAF